MLWTVTAESVLYALNHAYAALLDGATLSQWLAQMIPLLLFVALLIAAIRQP